jgi:predicted amidophosphoribosyltransferase
MSDSMPPYVDLADIVRQINEPAVCCSCGFSGPKNGWGHQGNPMCARCVYHFDHHKRFDPRCAICWIDRQEALREAARIRLFQKGTGGT